MEQWFMDWKRGTPVSELVTSSAPLSSTSEPLAAEAESTALGPLEAALLAQAHMQSMEQDEAATFSLSRAQLGLIEERKALALEKLAKVSFSSLPHSLCPHL